MHKSGEGGSIYVQPSVCQDVMELLNGGESPMGWQAWVLRQVWTVPR